MAEAGEAGTPRWRKQQKATPKVPEAQAVLDFFKENVLAVPGADEERRARTPSPRAALDRAEAALGSSFVAEPAVEASIRTTLGETYLGLGEPAKAIHQLDKALALRQQALGFDKSRHAPVDERPSPTPAWPAARSQRARLLYEEALSRGKAAMGAEDPDVLTFMNNLGRAYLASEPAMAEPVLREALSAWMRKARDDWHTYEAASLMGGYLLIRKNYAGAEPYLIQGYEGLKDREASIPDDIPTADRRGPRRIIALYDAWGKPEKAEEWRRKRVAETPKVHPGD